MPSSKKADKLAFAEALLPVLNAIDFECTEEKREKFDGTHTIIYRDGKHYDIKWHYWDTRVELRVHSFDYNPREVLCRPGIDECCFVYSNIPIKYSRPLRFRDCIIDQYYIECYTKYDISMQKCFYCGYGCKTGTNKNHEKSKGHIKKQAAVIIDLAKAARLPEDCMRHILSYLNRPNEAYAYIGD